MSTVASPVTLITGAGSGIGAATAARLVADGHRVICSDRNLEAAQAIAADTGAVSAVALDVADDEACRGVVELIRRDHRQLDGLVHCAGVWEPALALAATEQSYDRVMGINLIGSFAVTTAVGQAIIEQGTGGAIVLLASVNAVRADKGQAIYASSKAGVRMLAEVLALEWAEFGIRVNSIGPGIIDTPMTSAALRGGGPGATRVVDRTPMARVGQPSEIADAAAFLLSSSASFITGAFLPVDGGWLAD